MQFSVSSLLLTLTSITAVAAQYTNQSKPFNLIVTSANKTINGSALSAYHEGAGIEALAITDRKLQQADASSVTFNFNASIYSNTVQNPKAGATGYLTYLLRGANFNQSEALSFSITPNTNVALPLFGFGSGQVLAFDEDGFLNAQYYVDDRTYPPTVLQGTTKAYYRWYACMSYFSGYQYHTVNWVYGDAKPENPTCVKVMVKRLFI